MTIRVLSFQSPQVPRPRDERPRREPTDDFSALASTDCSGWVSFVTNTVSPLHEAVLQSQRRLPQYNQVYPDGFELKEGQRPWPRAVVLTNYFRSDHLNVTGFERVERYQDLRLGDLAAYSVCATSWVTNVGVAGAQGTKSRWTKS